MGPGKGRQACPSTPDGGHRGKGALHNRAAAEPSESLREFGRLYNLGGSLMARIVVSAYKA